MIIKKYLAKTEIEAIEKAKEELGSSAIVMNVKTVKPHGLKRIFLRPKVEVTAALDENKSYSDETVSKTQTKTVAAGNTAADRTKGSKIDLSIPPTELPPIKPSGAMSDEKQTNEERLSMLFSLLEKQMEEKSYTPQQKRTPSQETSNVRAGTEDVKDTSQRTSRPEAKPDIKDVPVREKTRSDDENTGALHESEEDEKEDKGKVYRELVYKQLVGNEVDPSIAERIIDEAKRTLPTDAAVDQILGSVYQRIILMIGQPYTIKYKPNEPTKFIFFLGSTGVGKTTTIAKLASKLKLEQNAKLALVTADTYRVAAVEQLRVYADILSVPLSVVYKPEELAPMIDELERYDIVLIDTAGFSYKNKDQINDLKVLLEQVPISKRQVYLALSVGTKYKDLLEITKVYSEITDYSIIFTKLDETSSVGVMLNIKLDTKCPLSYITNGQQVPDDIEIIDAQSVAKQLLS